MNIFKSRFRNKLIFAFVLLGTVPAIAVGIYASCVSTQSFQRLVDVKNTSEVEQAKLAVEQQLSLTDSTVLQLLESSTVDSAQSIELTGSEFEKFSELRKSIVGLPSSLINITNIYIVNTKMQWVIGTSQNYSLNDFEEKDNLLNWFLKQNQSSMWLDAFAFRGEKPIDGNGVVFIKKLNKNNACLAIVSVPYASLYSLMSHKSGPGAVMVVSGSGGIVESDDLSQCGVNISQTSLFAALKAGGESGNFESAYKGSLYLFHYVKSDYSGWYYLSAWPVSDIQRQEKQIVGFTVFGCFLFIVLTCTFSFLLSGKLYRPVGKLLTQLQKEGDDEACPQKDLFAKDELSFIENNVSYMISSSKTLHSQMYRQLNQLKDYFIIRLLTEKTSYDLIASKIDTFGFDREPGTMVVFNIQIDALDETQYGENDRDLLLYGIKNIVGELLADKIVGVPVVSHAYQAVILKAHDPYQDAIFRDAQSLQETIGRVFGCSVSIGVSSLLGSYEDVHRGYLESVEALQSIILFEGSTVSFYEDICKQNDLKSFFPSETEREVIEAVRSCDRVQCREMLHQFVEYIFSSEANRTHYRLFTQRLLLDLMILRNSIGTEEGNFQLKYMQRLFEIRSRKELEAWLCSDVTEPIMQQLERHEGCNAKAICQKVLDIIHHEYESKITLQECAARLHYYPSYIRRVLKQEMGINFSEYLMQYRINISKKWLLGSDMHVYEIAQRLKYENTGNFIRSFKKAVGVTPEQFRKNKEKV